MIVVDRTGSGPRTGANQRALLAVNYGARACTGGSSNANAFCGFSFSCLRVMPPSPSLRFTARQKQSHRQQANRQEQRHHA